VKIVVRPTPEEAASAAASHLSDLLDACVSPVLGVATGSSPQPLYRELARRVEAGELDLSTATAFALDEYVGLPAGHPESYASVIRRDVTVPLRLDPRGVHVPDGTADDHVSAAAAFEREIAAVGGVDVQILGIGTNGHIGFNEPGSSPDSRTRRVDLTPETRRSNARYFDTLEDVPRFAVSQGIGTILAARHIILVANGEAKAAAVARAVTGPVDAESPASFLQGHPDVTLFLDAAAARDLPADVVSV
jgi:glucosamine-6-phosphate deaminase